MKECVILKKIVCPHEEISGADCSLCKIPDPLELFHFPEPDVFCRFLPGRPCRNSCPPGRCPN